MIDPVLSALSRLSSAEEFLDYLEVSYEPEIVRVNRLHILKRFQKYLLTASAPEARSESELRFFYRGLLEQAYQDFVSSTPLQEKVFAVFRRPALERKPAAATVAVEDLRSSLRGGCTGSRAPAAPGSDLRSGGARS
ncbi:Nitrogenase-stabilizing/protective protein NifW [Methylacidimicrobium cyclopophantes]|uniref:Nitrogenase-stabilizing/protective protein NifW n=1 Tax=Methylacidimicrobium cyclopophantes TaxID=1041766 RepID=A0A5E6MEW2_9BACT|nr:nitrogenase-stabilizing/protective protein NifW [Methylacidimicrobium cyclopophantes]VVM04607.1 Nitrogenase-stabilizing/protective protein NifW [Methylacidimicrobium cyclopophantes]